jgi:hypothetical protein
MCDVGLHVHYYCLLAGNGHLGNSNLSRIKQKVHK